LVPAANGVSDDDRSSYSPTDGSVNTDVSMSEFENSILRTRMRELEKMHPEILFSDKLFDQ